MFWAQLVFVFVYHNNLPVLHIYCYCLNSKCFFFWKNRDDCYRRVLEFRANRKLSSIATASTNYIRRINFFAHIDRIENVVNFNWQLCRLKRDRRACAVISEIVFVNWAFSKSWVYRRVNIKGKRKYRTIYRVYGEERQTSHFIRTNTLRHTQSHTHKADRSFVRLPSRLQLLLLLLVFVTAAAAAAFVIFILVVYVFEDVK